LRYKFKGYFDDIFEKLLGKELGVHMRAFEEKINQKRKPHVSVPLTLLS
jgi:hypothetical protein